MRQRGIKYLTFQGGEPLVHPAIVRLVPNATATGLRCAVITNGCFLSRHIDSLAAAGLTRLIISIDSASLRRTSAIEALRDWGSVWPRE